MTRKRYGKREKACTDVVEIPFYYEQSQWMAVCRKGHYGLFCGSQVEFYQKEDSSTKYASLRKEQILDTAVVLYHEDERMYVWGRKSWQLGLFQLDEYIPVNNLKMRIRIIFPNVEMALAFVHGLKKKGCPIAALERNCTWVILAFTKGNQEWNSWRMNIKKWILSRRDQFRIRFFQFCTRPFIRPVDKLLFFYYQFPYLKYWLIVPWLPKANKRKNET